MALGTADDLPLCNAQDKASCLQHEDNSSIPNCPGAGAESIKMMTFSGSRKEGCSFGRWWEELGAAVLPSALLLSVNIRHCWSGGFSISLVPRASYICACLCHLVGSSRSWVVHVQGVPSHALKNWGKAG